MKNIKFNTSNEERHANWLELFYDLVYVIIIARLTHMIIIGHDGHIVWHDYVVYVSLFFPVWWIWTGHTLYENRFGSDDSVDRLLTLAQIFCAILLAVSVTQALDTSHVQFTLAYTAIRIILVLMYLRVYISNPPLRGVSGGFITGFSAGIAMWLLSLGFEPPLMFLFWGVGLLIDMLTPLLLRSKLSTVPVHKSHLPERTGLLVIILLGESVAGLVSSTEQFQWHTTPLLNLLLAFALLCTIWWLYFDTMEKTLMGKLKGTAQLHIYGHLPIYIGLGLLAASLRHLVVEDYTASEFSLLLSTSLLFILLPLQLIHYRHIDLRNKKPFLIRGTLICTLLIVLGVAGRYTHNPVSVSLALLVLLGYIYFETRYVTTECSEAT